MNAFSFRWQQILHLRQQKLRQAETHLAGIALRRTACRESLHQLERDLQSGAPCGPRGPTAPSLACWDASYRQFELFQQQLTERRCQLAQWDLDWEQAKAEYECRHREVEVLEKLKQRQMQAFVLQRERAELQQLDDLVLQRRSYELAAETRRS